MARSHLPQSLAPLRSQPALKTVQPVDTRSPYEMVVQHAMLFYMLDIMLTLMTFSVAKVLFLLQGQVTHPEISSPQLQIVDALALIAIWTVVFIGFQIYHVVNYSQVVNQIKNIAFCAAISLICLAGVLHLLDMAYPAIFLIEFLVLDVLILSGVRVLWYAALRYSNAVSVPKHRVLLIGANRAGEQICQTIQRQKPDNIELIGFIDNTSAKHVAGVPVLGNIASLASVVTANRIHDVIVVPENDDTELIGTIVKELSFVPVSIYLTLNELAWALYAYTTPEVERRTPPVTLNQALSSFPLISIRSPELTVTQYMVKRLMDITLVMMIMPVLLPIMAVVAAAIKLDTPGDALFRQKRMGENGRTFTILKFRSMVKDAETLSSKVIKYDEQGNIIHKVASDMRVTRVGHWIRRTSLDELPQFINILKGDMSLIGPRPEILSLIGGYQSWQYKRFSVPQGLSGWWQVNGRSEKVMHLNTIYDVYYVQNYSLALDIQILLKTVPAVLRGHGAF